MGELLNSWTKDLLNLIEPLHKSNPKIIHRDINPHNILVKEDDLNLVLLDLSNAIFLEPHKSYKLIGCPGFIAPEQIEGKFTARGDIYSIGALLYYLNSGKWPPTIEDRRYRNIKIGLKELKKHYLWQ